MKFSDRYPIIVTPHKDACRDFWVRHLGFEVGFDAAWFCWLHAGDASASIAFMTPDHPSAPPGPGVFSGQGVCFELQVENVDAAHAAFAASGAAVGYALTDEPFGQRRFGFADPSGLWVDVVQQIDPAPEYWQRCAPADQEIRMTATDSKGAIQVTRKNTVCLWYDKDAEQAARFYAKTFPDSAMGAVLRAPGDYPSGKQGDVLTVEFTVAGIACIGVNGGPAFKHNEAFSFQIATDDQAETDRLWNAIVGNGGQESACGWCKDKWGVSWQITPRALLDAITDPDRAAAKRAFDAMMEMGKIDIAAIEAARRG